jgi:hypothetical protein
MAIFEDLYNTYLNDKKRKERESLQQRATANIPNDMASMGYVPEQDAMGAPVAPVAPQRAPAPQMAPTQQAAPAPQAAPAAGQDFLKYTGQNESGNNPNMGYHYAPNAQGQRKSSAYGQYGMTAPAYKDVQSANPQFQGRDISTLSPDEQGQAALQYKQVLAKQLQAKGIEPTEENIRGAWLAGAGGMSKFRKTGAVSPEAAAANGGEAAFRQTLQNRMAGGTAPASGAVNAPMPQQPMGQQAAVPGQPPVQQAPVQQAPVQEDPNVKFTNIINSNNKEQMLQFYNDPNAPQWQKDAVVRQMSQVVQVQEKVEKGQALAQQAMATGDPKSIDKALRDKDYGKYAMAWLASGLGFTSLAKDLMAEAGSDQFANFSTAKLDEQDVSVKYNGTNGRAIDGYNLATGQRLTPKELARMDGMGGGSNTAKPEVGKVYVKYDDAGNITAKGRLVTEFRNNKASSYVDMGNGKKEQFGKDWVDETVSVSQLKGENAAKTGANYAEITAALKGSGETKGKLTEFGYGVQQGPNGQTIITKNGQAVQPGANGSIQITDKAGQPVNLAELQTRKALTEKSGEKVVNYTDVVADDADKASKQSSLVSNNRRLLEQPGAKEIFAMANGWGKDPSDQRIRIFTDILTGKVAHAGMERDFQQRVAALGLSPEAQSILSQYNNTQSQINAMTLRQNVGPGSVSDAEQQLNKEANVDITKSPALPAFNELAQRQYEADLMRYKNDFIRNLRKSNPDADRLDLQSAWDVEASKARDTYLQASQKRLGILGANPTYDTIVNAYKQVPIPTYTPGEGFKSTGSAPSQPSAPGASTGGIRILKREKIQ